MWINTTGIVQDHLIILGTLTNPVYLIKGKDEYILVESGVTRDAPTILSQLKEHVSDLSLIKHWFITHSHYDHCGTIESLYPYFRNVQLYASEYAVSNFRNEKYVKKIRQLNALISDQEITGFPADLQQIPFITVKDNDIIETDSGIWQILYTPGHSQCSVSLYHKESDTLFVSDALGEIIGHEKWFPLAFDHVEKFVESINRLNTLHPQTIALGHNGILTGSDARLAPEHSLRGYHETLQFISELQHTLSHEQLIDEICKKFKVMDHSFISDKVYRKSIEMLLFNLKTESIL
ncbi:MBL fold metallo-hydrolase [Chryseobacterium phosphatilyticum]|nr:MBL fold metallo-hydrolase [Chryseobacterium phosphatilyticum]